MLQRPSGPSRLARTHRWRRKHTGDTGTRRHPRMVTVALSSTGWAPLWHSEVPMFLVLCDSMFQSVPMGWNAVSFPFPFYSICFFFVCLFLSTVGHDGQPLYHCEAPMFSCSFVHLCCTYVLVCCIYFLCFSNVVPVFSSV